MLFWFVLSFALSLLLVGLLRRRLLAMHMLDHPGQRRLHSAPVARGGGLAIVAAAMAVMLIAARATEDFDLLPLNGGLLIVAGVGWWDDRGGIGIAPRLLVHLLAAASVCAVLWQLGFISSADLATAWWLIPMILIGVVASINLHNFIDGANGMLGLQSLFVLAMLFVFSRGAEPALTVAVLCCAGAVLGFLPWNFPTARVFMGDVGSGALGYLLAALSVVAWAVGIISLVDALLLHSLVLIDGLCTIGLRMYSARRWWRAHREHFYQWLVRTGRSHARVVTVLQAWNLLLILPLVLWLRMRRVANGELVAFNTGLQDPLALWLLIGVFSGGVSIWWFGKRRLLGAYRAKYRHDKQRIG